MARVAAGKKEFNNGENRNKAKTYVDSDALAQNTTMREELSQRQIFGQPDCSHRRSIVVPVVNFVT